MCVCVCVCVQVMCLGFSSCGKYVAFGDYGAQATLLAVETGEQVWQKKLAGPVRACAAPTRVHACEATGSQAPPYA